MNLTTVGIDLAKTSFSLIGIIANKFIAPFRKGGKKSSLSLTLG